MKIFKVIRKAWLQYWVDKYTLKSQDFYSKSDHFLNLAEYYRKQASDLNIAYPVALRNSIAKYNIESTKYFNKSDHYKHLAEIYENKKLDLEKRLQYYKG